MVKEQNFNKENLNRCTGLKDFHGNFIYENDIVRSRFNNIIKAKVFWDEETASFKLNYGEKIPPVSFYKGDSKDFIVLKER